MAGDYGFFESLEVWKRGCSLAVRVYEILSNKTLVWSTRCSELLYRFRPISRKATNDRPKTLCECLESHEAQPPSCEPKPTSLAGSA
jgi:hypothetical protein